MQSRARALSSVLAAFLAGIVTGAAVTAGAGSYPFEKLRVFSEALSRIDSFYVDERDSEELLYDAIGGLTQGLDDYSVFLDPDSYQEMQEQTTGEYFGIGISIDVREEKIFVLEPLPGSPAEQAGIVAGDEILAVDDRTVEDLGVDAALARIRGDRGTVVVLLLAREDREASFETSVRRDRIRTSSVSSRLLDNGVGMLQVERFQRQTVEEVRRAIAELEDSASADLAGIVLDLRGNPGGYLSQAVAVADLWVSEGTIVSTLDRGHEAHRDLAHQEGTDTDTPIAVLIDGGSASASEIVAGALRDHRRARLIGYTTYGKGSVQQFFDLSDGSALKLTTARYYTPGGHNIHGSGIEPELRLGPRGSVEPAWDLEPLLSKHPAGDDVAQDPVLHTALAWFADPEGVESWFAALERSDNAEAEGSSVSEPAQPPSMPLEVSD